MDESELLTLLGQLDARLTSAYDIVIVGGAAMILHFGASRATRDVDAIVLKGNPRQLRNAVATHHLSRARPDWAQRMQYFLEEQGWNLD